MAHEPFQRLIDRHGEDVLRLLVAQLGRSDAEDAFQETFLAALAAYPRLRERSDTRAWLITIAYRKAMDAHRARRRHASAVADPPEPAAAEPRPAPADDTTWAAVRALPDRQRAVLTLRYAGDLTHAEIASVLDCTEAASRRAASDGLATLRKEITA